MYEERLTGMLRGKSWTRGHGAISEAITTGMVEHKVLVYDC